MVQLVHLQGLGWTRRVLRQMTSLSTMSFFRVPIAEDVNDIKLWWQTWLEMSALSVTSTVKTALCQ